MCKRWIAADYNRLTVCLNTTALALVSKVTTDFNERERESESGFGRCCAFPLFGLFALFVCLEVVVLLPSTVGLPGRSLPVCCR